MPPIKIKLKISYPLKDGRERHPGDIILTDELAAKHLVETGAAEYINEGNNNSDTFNEADVRAHYGHLGHYPAEYTTIRVLDPTNRDAPPLFDGNIKGEPDFVKICEKYAGKGNVYAGLNPRKDPVGSDGSHVSRRTAILIDIDRHHGDEAATDAELEDAAKDVEKVLAHLKANGHPEPYVAMSGNGFHIILTVDLPAQPDVADRIDAFYDSLPIKVDHKNRDLARISKVIGTMSVKGSNTPERPHRLSSAINQGSWENDKALEAYLKGAPNGATPKPFSLQTPSANENIDAKRFKKYLKNMRPCIRAMLTNENEGAQSENGDLDHEAHLLIVKDAQFNGLGYAEICALFVQQPDYKPKVTEDKVAYAIQDNVKKGITPWYCNNLIERGWCNSDNSELCAYMMNDPNIPQKKKEPTDKGAELIKIAKDHAKEFFRDQYQTGYATLPINMDRKADHDALYANDAIIRKPMSIGSNPLLSSSPESSKSALSALSASLKKTVPINSRVFKWWIARLYHEKTKQTVASDSIKSASLVLEAETQTQPMRFLYNRLAPNGGLSYWWDMGDEYGRAIHISKDGWRIEDDPPQIFRRYPHTLPIPEPEKGGTLEPFLDYLNLDDPGDKLLAIVATISYLVPEVPRIGTTITGRQGSGKSTFHRLQQNLIDPSSGDLLNLPTKDDDLIQILEHHYLAVFDNVGAITKTQSDILCRAITGAGNEKRELYTTDDSFIRQYMRCIGLNGITVPIEKSDLFSRNLLLPWTQIKSDERQTDAEMKAKMLKDAPKLIGAMLDTLVKAIQFYPDVKPTLDGRMADYIKWGIAITKAIGLSQRDFEAAYATNLKTQDEEAVKSSMVAEQLIRYMKRTSRTIMSGTATDLKAEIEDEMNPLDDRGHPIGDLLSKKPGWPKTPKDFSIQLTEVAPALESLGYKVSVTRSEKARGLRIEKIVAINEPSTEPGQRSFNTIKPSELTDTKLREALKKAGVPGPEPDEGEETAAHFGVSHHAISDWELKAKPTTNVPGDISCKPDDDEEAEP